MQLQFVIYCYLVLFMFLFAWYTWNGGIFAYLSREKKREKEKLICYINICGFICICNLVILIFISFKTLYVYFFLYIYTFVKWYIILNEVKLITIHDLTTMLGDILILMKVGRNFDVCCTWLISFLTGGYWLLGGWHFVFYHN